MKIGEVVYASIPPRFGTKSPPAHAAGLYSALHNVIGDKGIHSNLAALCLYVYKITVFDAALFGIQRIDHHRGHRFFFRQSRNGMMKCVQINV
ncbi:hypothetical protein ES703_104543 [subsurface metagenome]